MTAILAAIRNMVMRARVDRPGATPQLIALGGRAYPSVENRQPQGLYFNPPAGAVGVMVSPAGDPSAAMAVGVGGTTPDAPAAGEGGLHYLGTFKVFLAADGTVHLGQKDPTDFVALASKVDAALTAFETWAGTHVHAGVTPGGGASGPATPPAAHTPVGSVSVKCKT